MGQTFLGALLISPSNHTAKVTSHWEGAIGRPDFPPLMLLKLRLIGCLVLETGSGSVAQAGLELLGLSNSPASAS